MRIIRKTVETIVCSPGAKEMSPVVLTSTSDAEVIHASQGKPEEFREVKSLAQNFQNQVCLAPKPMLFATVF